ncbi:type A2 lantipeptide [Streptomyces winkii]|uniref:type A2 lantipeptide n=1 Tax=Streptomyces winkii TaxID=3051178 RepID=UPI0028D518BE|nr:type A2 lantipeptide [Streptomyces sp. DSM 40971]
MRDMTQIETAEISDTALDAVSGGVGASLGGAVTAGLDGVAGSLSGGVDGVGGVSGTVSGTAPSVEGVTGLLG